MDKEERKNTRDSFSFTDLSTRALFCGAAVVSSAIWTLIIGTI